MRPSINTPVAVARPACPMLVRNGRVSSSLRTSAKLPGRPLFDRDFEREQLQARFKTRPEDMLGLSGPRSSGKSALLTSLLGGQAGNEGTPAAVYVNCRLFDASSPRTFISALMKQLLPIVRLSKNRWLEVLQIAMQVAGGLQIATKMGGTGAPASEEVSLKLADLPKALLDQTPAAAKEPDLNALLEALRTMLDGWEESCTGDYRPVLVVDDAHLIMSRGDQYPDDLAALLRFFIAITKETGRCHVVLASSEFSFHAWLQKAIGAGFLAHQVIGDFAEEDARKFLQEQLLGPTVPVDESAWKEIYQVCGGNAGVLVRLAALAKLKTFKGNWTAALKELWTAELRRVRLMALGGPGYAAEHYTAAATELLSKKAVSEMAMQELLGKYELGPAATKEDAVAAGRPVLDSLVQANAVSVRPMSTWARDIPVEAFVNEEPVVTAPSTVELYCMKLLQDRGVLKKTEPKKQQGAPAAPAAAAATTTSQPSPLAVYLEIGKEIERMRSEMKAAREKGDTDVVADLRAEIKELRAERTLLLRNSSN